MIPASQPAAIKWYDKELTPQERGPTELVTSPMIL